MTSKISWSKLLPVFMSYIVMGFVDIVGVSTGYIQKDFDLPDNLAQLIPSMAFIWFFLLSVPVGIFQDKWGKRNMLVLGMALSGVGMLIPFIGYSFSIMLAAFVFLGIGNTIVQVSANPLLQDVSPRERFSSFMSLTQFVKAIVSLLGPIIAATMATQFGDWKLVFAVYAVTSLLAVVWLYFTQIEESGAEKEPATFKSCFSLLKNSFILMMVLGIFLTVGADVAMNSNIQNYMMHLFSWSIEEASLGISVYFVALMISRFLGAILLNFIKPKLFLIITTTIALLSVLLMFMAPSPTVGLVAIFLVGFGSGNLFPLIFSIAVDKMPERSNEISGLMIMAVSGGAFIPPIMGAISEYFGFMSSLSVLVICMVYLFILSIAKTKKA
ncbi:MFS transporter [Tamlana fucoidanivorans]|uniref:Sugar MFS transporter n=1 Tax=Allotamlana fucoidanivorans TaxID=2583814 RepID=A0A5C4SNB4_9FLAO|nr:MFS transporter [Tamlana fucoidanivorans]TNJ44892.1 sugar MFS transporter [Tamlana fucoidanivorans]